MRVRERMAGETAKAYALREISENIISLELKPGALVSENELARALGVSRTPVREALQELQKSQLIEVFPQRGSYVAGISFEAVEEAAFLRRTLEIAITEELCDKITFDQLEQLSENVGLQEYYLNNGMSSKIMDLDNQFHKDLFLMCGKERTYNIMQSIMGHFDRIRILSLHTIKDIKIVTDHRAILEAIKSGNKEEVRDLISRHLMRYKFDKKELEKNYPDYFKNN
ncbi:MAG: GntR family transcriptional regulator [Lachnospiraceae bacterium]|nr:GntR family transcriptional regulator [Lachnospiraceae bacterium]